MKSVKANVCINPYVRGSVRISVMNSIYGSVYDSVMNSVYDSVMNSVTVNQFQIRDGIRKSIKNTV
jgi:hypothetical protein